MTDTPRATFEISITPHTSYGLFAARIARLGGQVVSEGSNEGSRRLTVRTFDDPSTVGIMMCLTNRGGLDNGSVERWAGNLERNQDGSYRPLMVGSGTVISGTDLVL